MRRIFLCLFMAIALAIPVRAEPIKWVDFSVPFESLEHAMEQDIATFEEEKHISWIDILALAACRTGGKCHLAAVKRAAADLLDNKDLDSLLGSNFKYFDYYQTAYRAVLGWLLVSYAIE